MKNGFKLELAAMADFIAKVRPSQVPALTGARRSRLLLDALRHLAQHISSTADGVPRKTSPAVAVSPLQFVVNFCLAAKLPFEGFV